MRELALITGDLLTENEPRPPAFSDEALALRFADQHARDLRFVSSWNRWLLWDGARWQSDSTLFALYEARQVCRAASLACNDTRMAAALASRKTICAVEALARADRRLAATVSQWDANPWLLNTPSGVFDLRTGVRREHRPSDYITRITASAPEGDCPIFETFILKAMDGEMDMVRFLQRLFGYALTGSTQEHALFFAHGTGANGKSVLFSTIGAILGDYHMTAAMETFTATAHERHPTELARLRGARLVTAVETEEGRRWAEGLIKTLTGGDRVAARFMRQDYFEYDPEFKLIIAGNHRPGVRSMDEAFRRRLKLIPFNVTIPPEERDPQLAQKLKAEWPGILKWMLEGCHAWRKEGLAPPWQVQSATAAYFEAEDTVSAWIEDSCTRDPSVWSSSSDLFRSWSTWADKAGEHAGSTKRFCQALETRGFIPMRKTSGRGFIGIKVVRP